MSKYISIRGWIECEDDSINGVISIIEKYKNKYSDFDMKEEQSLLYQKGWVVSNNTVGWVRYVFFGADVRSYYVDFIKRQLQEISLLNSEIEGKFFMNDDEGELSRCLKIMNGNINEIPIEKL